MTLRFRDATFLHPRRGERIGHGVHDVTLDIEPGAVTAVIGPNGAGKTTLLRLASGTLTPQSGQVMLDDANVAHMEARHRARRIGYVPQGNHVDHAFTVRDVVMMGRFAHLGRWRGPEAADTEAVAQAIDAMALQQLVDRPVTSLSGGERRRVLLARVQAQGPATILLDEPTANLDLGQRWRTDAWMRRLAADGHTVLVVLHDLAAAAQIAHHVVLLAEGRVLRAGTPEETLRAEHLSRAYGTQVAVSREGSRWHFEPQTA